MKFLSGFCLFLGLATVLAAADQCSFIHQLEITLDSTTNKVLQADWYFDADSTNGNCIPSTQLEPQYDGVEGMRTENIRFHLGEQMHSYPSLHGLQDRIEGYEWDELTLRLSYEVIRQGKNPTGDSLVGSGDANGLSEEVTAWYTWNVNSGYRISHIRIQPSLPASTAFMRLMQMSFSYFGHCNRNGETNSKFLSGSFDYEDKFMQSKEKSLFLIDEYPNIGTDDDAPSKVMIGNKIIYTWDQKVECP